MPRAEMGGWGALREMVREDPEKALLWGIIRRAQMDAVNRPTLAKRFATKPLPFDMGNPCRYKKDDRWLTCRAKTCERSGGDGSCWRYGLGFLSLEQELDVFWRGDWGKWIRESLGIEYERLGRGAGAERA